MRTTELLLHGVTYFYIETFIPCLVSWKLFCVCVCECVHACVCLCGIEKIRCNYKRCGQWTGNRASINVGHNKTTLSTKYLSKHYWHV